MKPSSFGECWSRLFVGFAAFVLTSSAVAAPAEKWRAIVSRDLQYAYASAAAANAAPATVNAATVLSGAHVDAQGRVQVDVNLDCAVLAPVAALTAAGLKISQSVKVPPYCVIEGWVLPKGIPTLGSTMGVTLVKSPSYALHRSPRLMKEGGGIPAPVSSGISNGSAGQGIGTLAIDGTAISIMRADQFVAKTSVNGSGVVVGVMSGDATSLSVIQLRGELPPSVRDLTPSSNIDPSPTDEGTMMLEEVHAVAPGANLLFCGAPTSAGYLPCISTLINAGATLLVDDLAWPGEDMMSSNSSFAQAVQSTLAQSPDVALFTVTANQNGTYWEGPYAPVSLASLGYAPLTCAANGQVDSYAESFSGQYQDNLSVMGNGPYAGYFQWADPYTQNGSNFDLYIRNNTTGAVTCFPGAGSTLSQIGVAGFSAGAYAIGIGTPDTSLTGKFLKLFVNGDGLTTLSPSTPGSIYSPQAFVTGVTTIGAVKGSDGIGDTIETYSGLGPISLSFPTPTELQAPSVVAPDDIYVDATNTNFQVSPDDGYFKGTSAAAPNAAAVAALLRSAFPSLTPAELTSALQSGATPLGLSTPNSTYGYGRVDAIGALGAIAGPSVGGFTTATIVGGSRSTSLPINIGGTGNLNLSISPASLIPADSSGVQLSPANCGSGTNVCSVVLTPSMGQSGLTMVTISVTDGAKRTASYQASVTVNKPPAPTVVITSGGSQSVTVNAALQPVSFAVSGTGPLTVTPATNGVTQLAISPGCGTTQMQCTATLGTANSSAGFESLSINATDSYGQAASAKATFNVTQPSSGGGEAAVGQSTCFH